MSLFIFQIFLSNSYYSYFNFFQPFFRFIDLTLNLNNLLPSEPSNFTCLFLLKKIDPFKRIDNFVEFALLDFQMISCEIQINCGIFTVFDELNKFFCEIRQLFTFFLVFASLISFLNLHLLVIHLLFLLFGLLSLLFH